LKRSQPELSFLPLCILHGSTARPNTGALDYDAEKVHNIGNNLGDCRCSVPDEFALRAICRIDHPKVMPK
jgi:hypothetical protein